MDTVYLGEVKSGATLTVSGIWLYSPDRAREFKVGDKLFAFLEPADPKRTLELPEGSLIPVESGFKLMLDGKVCGFLQERNPGLFDAITPEWNPNASFPSLVEFRKSLDNSLKLAAMLKDAWKKPAVPTETPQLLEILRQRREVACDGYRHADWIGHAAALRLISLFDPPSVCAGIDADPNQARLLSSGFNTPEGREFLLKKVADRTTQMPLRAMLAGDLAGEYAYGVRMINGADGGLTIAQGVRVPTNGDYLKRCATLAVATEDSPEVCLAILRALEFSARWNDPGRDADIKSDLANAAEVLRPFYAKSSMEEAKYEIEIMTLAIGADAYSKLESKDGGVIGIVQLEPANEYDSWAKIPGHLSLAFHCNLPAQFHGIDSMQLEMQSVADKKIYPLPEGNLTPDQHDDHGVAFSVSAGIQVILPTVPKGRYHIFYRLIHGSDVVGQSFGFDIDR